MFKKPYKLWLAALFFILLIGAQSVQWQGYLKRAEVIFLDVGQGDAALLLFHGQVILVDGGPDDSLLQGLGRWLPYFERTIDYLVISHDHDDHVVGLVEALQRYKIKNIIYGSALEGASIARQLRRQAKEKNLNLRQITKTASLSLDRGCNMEIINPGFLAVKEDENNSLVVEWSCLGRKLLLMGDNSARVETALLAARRLGKADVLKAGHHGSKTSSSLEFLSVIVPRYLVISAGEKNLFGHPHIEVLSRAAVLGLTIKRTDQEGDIRIKLSPPVLK